MTNLQANRTRTITWEDPTTTVQTGKTISGITYLKALQSGELPPPPIAVLLGMSITEVSEGRAVFAAEPSEYHYNPLGTVHGGVMATLLDSALGCAVQSMLPAGTSYTTLELKVNYLRPITARTGTVYAERKDHSRWRTHSHRRRPFNRRRRQTLCTWNHHMYYLAPIITNRTRIISI